MDRYFGMSGFASPVTDVINGVEFRYDLYHVESKKLIKVFTNLNKKELSHYGGVEDSRDVAFIVEACNFDDSCLDCKFDDISAKVLKTALKFDALIFFNGELWECQDDGEWLPMLPLEREKCIDALLNI